MTPTLTFRPHPDSPTALRDRIRSLEHELALAEQRARRAELRLRQLALVASQAAEQLGEAASGKLFEDKADG